MNGESSSHRPSWDTVTLTTIGYVHSPRFHRFEAPRQSTLATETTGTIELKAHCNFETALADLKGFERIWVVYLFHLNQTWSPKVRPPIAPPDKDKIGVFATRSPHRPNPIGLSCVRLDEIKGRVLYIRQFDMLDGTPVLDIKPYIPMADAFPKSACGWLDQAGAEHFDLHFSPEFLADAERLIHCGGVDVINFCRIQLAVNPLQRERKRLTCLDETLQRYAIGCRTWKIEFCLDAKTHLIHIEKLSSNYTAAELALGTADPYADKDIHRLWLQQERN